VREPLLVARGLGKAYGAPVLRGVDLELQPGQVHAVVGENGAGKSTLAKILAGLVRADEGEMTLRGAPYAPRDRAEARDRGIGIVHQEPSTISTLTVAETLFFDRLPARAFVLDRRRLRADARLALARVGLERVAPDRRVGSLGLGERQLLEIATALARRCDLLILDEPTAALAPAEVEMLFAQVDRLRSEGTAIVFISHRLDEVARLADQVSVLRDGERVATRVAAELDHDELVRLMVGRPLVESPARAASGPSPVALAVRGLSGRGFHDVSFDVHRGEIVGLAGLMGAGRTEVLRAVFGADPKAAGRVLLGDATRPVEIRSPRQAVAAGLAFVTEDRQAEGLLLPSSVRANVTLGRLARTTRFGRVSRTREDALARPVVESLGVRARSLGQPVAQLSGGNQQKVVLARSLLREPEVLLVDEPTRGVDVGARAEVHQLLLGLAARGKAIVVASSEIEELLALCDRILVLCRGRLTASFGRGDGSPEAILAAAVGGSERAARPA
jgi:ribose transport system ATP-binding protein